MEIGIIGLGFVGSAIQRSLTLKKVSLLIYDKYKNDGIGKLENCLKAKF